MSKTHQAAWVDGAGQKMRVGPADTVSPGPGEVLIKNKAIAINPVDWKIQDYGLFVQKWPTILGQDIAGEIVEVGEGVASLKKGQRVIAHCLSLVSGKTEEAAFQELTVVNEKTVVPIPDSAKFEDASVLPLAVSTAAAGLFQPDFLALPYPTSKPIHSGKTLLLWGGSSSVGTATIQLAVAAGVDVITTASPRNFDLCKKLGAKKVFDYNSSSIVGDLVAELQEAQLGGAYDAIGVPESEKQLAQVLVQLGGGTIVTVLPPPEDIPATVNVKNIFGASIFMGHNDVGKVIYQDFLPKALASGRFEYVPEAEVVGKGIEDVQKACEKQKAGVSAKKIVLTL